MSLSWRASPFFTGALAARMRYLSLHRYGLVIRSRSFNCACSAAKFVNLSPCLPLGLGGDFCSSARCSRPTSLRTSHTAFSPPPPQRVCRDALAVGHRCCITTHLLADFPWCLRVYHVFAFFVRLAAGPQSAAPDGIASGGHLRDVGRTGGSGLWDTGLLRFG